MTDYNLKLNLWNQQEIAHEIHIPEYLLHWIKSLALAFQPHHWHKKNIYTQEIIMLLQKYNQYRVHPVNFQRSSSLFS